ncbi:hypothetical protein HWD31_gp49 [Pantoea phage vB_PagM_SSEM1]|uniref:Uncharacterized protein n=1 Tax=Pantoea phage vB_PagM_SSEM1 TaxID=2721760 RepID=A0A6H0D9V7_9CAUD|nr:hypothetical protein HWD31_gp49 [Pantoea phage vB_PagM_SSEM1]QIS79379.1 hypothetical protein SSEM1_gp49 [Pantoea phage vB_PagM_SSEM1]
MHRIQDLSCDEPGSSLAIELCCHTVLRDVLMKYARQGFP